MWFENSYFRFAFLKLDRKVLDFRAKYIVISSWEPNDLDECGVEKCAIKETA